jgi:hypothetical protein
MARETAWVFRRSIRRYSDPFSFRLLFAILRGRSPSLLELPDRPSAYEDVGRLCRWGMVISALRSHDDRRKEPAARTLWNVGTLEAYVESRHRERITNGLAGAAATPAAKPKAETGSPAPLVAMGVEGPLPAIPRPRARGSVASASPAGATPTSIARRASPRRASAAGAAKAPRGDAASRRRMPQRRGSDRRTRKDPIPFPDRRLTRSAYEQVFLKLVSGGRLRIGRDMYTPVGMKGWYHAILRRDSDGKERLLSVDQLLKKLKDWR